MALSVNNLGSIMSGRLTDPRMQGMTVEQQDAYLRSLGYDTNYYPTDTGTNGNSPAGQGSIPNLPLFISGAGGPTGGLSSDQITQMLQPNQTTTGITQLYDLISGLTGQDIRQGQQAAAAADPFASQRGQYQTELSNLMKDPSSFKTDPGYQFALQQGQDALLAKAGAMYGGGRAGAILPELAKYTEGYASQAYDNRINQLMQMAGVNAGSPGTAGAIMAGAFNNRDASLASGANVVGSLLDTLFGGGNRGGAISALRSLFSGGSDFDLSNLSNPDFWNSLTTPGGQFGVDPGVAQDLAGVISPPGATPSFDWITNSPFAPNVDTPFDIGGLFDLG